MLGAHLLGDGGAVQPKKCMLTQPWLSHRLHKQLGYSYRVITGSRGKRPDDWEQQFEASKARIAGKAQVLVWLNACANVGQCQVHTRVCAKQLHW